MASYPTITSGTTTVTRISRRPVRVLSAVDRSEQRFKVAKQLEDFQVGHDGMSKADALALQAFVAARKGGYDIFDFTFGGVTYQNLSLDLDEAKITESALGQYNASVVMRQRQ